MSECYTQPDSMCPSTSMDKKVPDTLTLEEILKLNPHLDREYIERALEQLSKAPARPQPRGPIAPDRLHIGDPSRTRKVRLRYYL